MSFSWTCPFCDRPTTITEEDYHMHDNIMAIQNKHGRRVLQILWIVCPNDECKEYTLVVSIFEWLLNTRKTVYEKGDLIESWNLIPLSQAKVFPDYIPEAIRGDYLEACLIRDFSPKASATLSRRCLQGMIRDFWGVKKTKLKDAIDKIKNQVDPLTWKAIDVVRKVGNIGAHMEKDIDLIIDVDPNEASLLIGLIERLVKEWYIHKHERQLTMEQIITMSSEKEAQKKQQEADNSETA